MSDGASEMLSRNYQLDRRGQYRGQYPMIGASIAALDLMYGGKPATGLSFPTMTCRRSIRSTPRRSQPKSPSAISRASPAFQGAVMAIEAVALYKPDGVRTIELTPLANSATWSAAAVGGFASATFDLPGWVELNYLADIEIQDGDVSSGKAVSRTAPGGSLGTSVSPASPLSATGH